MGWLHSVPHHTHQLLAQGVEIGLIPELGRERFECLPCIVFVAVETTVYDGLDTAPQGSEKGCDQESGSHYRKGGSLAGKGYEEPLQQHHGTEVDGNQGSRQRTVDQGAVYDQVDLVEPVACYGDPHGDRYSCEASQNERASDPSE